MALTGNRILCNTPTKTPYTRHPIHRPVFPPPWSQNTRTLSPSLLIASASKKFSSSSRTGRFDSKNKRSSVSIKEEEVEEDQQQQQQQEWTADIGSGAATGTVDDGFVMPDLPGLEPDFWEGPQWDAFGFFIQYLWAFGIVFSLISSGIAVATYNEGATDFKETPVYKEAIQSQELLEEPDASNSDVFESNPTEEAPSLE